MSTPRKAIEKTTSGYRDGMHELIEQFMNGEIDAEYLNTVRGGLEFNLKTVQIDLQGLKMAADMRRERGGPREVADLNLNLKLGGQVSAGIASIADQPDQVTDVTPKPNSTVRYLRKSEMQKKAANQNYSSPRKRHAG